MGFSRAESVLENILCFYTVILSLEQIHFLISAERQSLFFRAAEQGAKVEKIDVIFAIFRRGKMPTLSMSF